jgi:hypothetical protein
MPRMADVIRDGSAPRSIVRRAARGELSVPLGEAIEILLILMSDRDFGAEAEQTLAKWDDESLVQVVSDAATPAEVLTRLLQTQSHRPALVTALCGNPAMPTRAEEDLLQAMMNSARVRNSSRLLDLMMANSASAAARPKLTQWLASAQGKEAEEVAMHFLVRHADVIALEDGKPFELVAASEGEDDPLGDLMARVKRGEEPADPEQRAQVSVLQRISRLRVGERIKLAVKGNREERMVLIRDRSKMVSIAVLESPKVNDVEMETFAAMKNVQESVLRAIAGKRSYMKNYGVLRTLANNPKTPLDVALGLVQHLTSKDQRALAVNKKLALRAWRLKTEKKHDE